MKKLKVLSVVGTRPEIIRLSRVLSALDKYETIEHIVVHTGQNYDYELNEVFFEDMGIRKPDVFLNAHERSEAMEEASVMMTSMNIDRVIQGLNVLNSQDRTLRQVDDYNKSNVSNLALFDTF